MPGSLQRESWWNDRIDGWWNQQSSIADDFSSEPWSAMRKQNQKIPGREKQNRIGSFPVPEQNHQSVSTTRRLYRRRYVLELRVGGLRTGRSPRAPFANTAKSAAPLKVVPGLDRLRCELLSIASVYAPPALLLLAQHRRYRGHRPPMTALAIH